MTHLNSSTWNVNLSEGVVTVGMGRSPWGSHAYVAPSYNPQGPRTAARPGLPRANLAHLHEPGARPSCPSHRRAGPDPRRPAVLRPDDRCRTSRVPCLPRRTLRPVEGVVQALVRHAEGRPVDYQGSRGCKVERRKVHRGSDGPCLAVAPHGARECVLGWKAQCRGKAHRSNRPGLWLALEAATSRAEALECEDDLLQQLTDGALTVAGSASVFESYLVSRLTFW